MKIFLYVVVLLFCVAESTWCSEPLSKQSPNIIAQHAPQSFVNDTVNVIDGNFCFQMHHLNVPGHIPLDLVQYYNSQSKYTPWLGIGMSLNYCFSMVGNDDSEKSDDKNEKYELLMAESPCGSIIRCIGKKSASSTTEYYLDPEVVHKGLTNCGTGRISARTNLKNVRLKETIKKQGGANRAFWKCYLPDGTVRKHYGALDRHEGMNVISEKRLDGASLDFSYYKYGRKEGRIKKIKAKARDTMNWLEFFSDYKKRKDTVVSSSGKKADFYYFKHDDDYYIHKIESTDNPAHEFFYKKAGDYYCINKVQWPEGRFLEVEYDDKGRVTFQKAPVGGPNEKHTIYSFEYHKTHTDVTDANGHKKIYHHKDGRITSIEDPGYRTQQYYWGKKEGLSWAKRPRTLEGNLLGYATLNSEGKSLLKLSYTYDDYGNITSETLTGNLTGSSEDVYKKQYQYSENHLLTYQSEDDGLSYEYRYINGSDLPWAKFVKDGDKIIMREFYEYDENGILKEKIIDDGNTDNKAYLLGVTQRLITHIWPVKNKTGYGQGLPEDVWENYVDLATGQNVLLKHTCYTYNQAGQVIEEAIFDASNKYCYSTSYEYDDKGNLHKKTDPLGQKTEYTYDANNNKHYEKQLGVDAHTIYSYDFANRLIGTTEYHYDNTEVHTAYAYDFMGNKVSSTDRYGQITRYEYDAYNRLKKIIFPDLTTIEKEYDVFDNVVKETNQNGAVTTFEYTIRNAPCLITYADGNKERFEYNKNGTLAHKWDQSGTKTSYEYDVLGRITKTTIYDGENRVLSSSINTYNAFHPLTTTDAMGLTTHYTYDYAGRKIQEYAEDGSNYSKTTFEYDTLGRLSETKRYYGSDKTNYISTCLEYDHLNRITYESNVDMQGKIISWTRFEYDILGNCILKRTGHIEGENAECTSEYNSKGELISQTDECNHKITFEYIHRDGLQKITTDALLNTTEEYYDIFGRLKTICKKSAQGALLAKTDFYYNATGKKIKQVEAVIVDGICKHEYVIAFSYDLLDRQLEVIEQPDSPLCKTTSYTYDPCGRVKTITKPSGTILTHAYDALGRLIELTSSDNSVSYSYTYDLNNSPLQVKDNSSGLVTKRAYDSWNRLTEDGIEGVHTSKYAYDAIGRLISLSEPDNSSIQYSYDNAYLRMIERFTKEGVKCYSHQYVNFDKNGRVVESKLINNLGKAHFAYDKKGRNTSTTTNYYSHSIPEDGYDAVGNLKIYHATDPVGSFTVTCTYDDLYQLTSESGLHNHIYAHDSLHNRLSKNETIYDVDILNKITSDGAANFSYDQNGNLLWDGKNNCRYDALDRLIEANGIRYVYDSFNRRIMRNDTYFLYHGLREVGTFENGKVKEFRVLGLGKGAELGASIAIELDGSVYCPIHDFRGNIVALIDESGQPAETYRYTAFGECEVLSHSSTLHNSWRFASKRYDPETGFTYFLRRYYSPSIGRWITPDPIGFTDGPNMYAYVHNNPFTGFDLYGLWGESIDYDDDDKYLPHVQFFNGFNTRYGSNQVETIVRYKEFMAHPGNAMENLFESTQEMFSSLNITSVYNTFASMTDAVSSLYRENNWSTASGILVAELSPGIDRLGKFAGCKVSQKVSNLSSGVQELLKESKPLRNSGRGKNKLKPHQQTPKESTFPGTHSTFKRDPKTGKTTHYTTWKANTNPHPLDPNPSPFKMHKDYHGTGENPRGHFMKQKDAYSGYPHIHRMKENPKAEIIEYPKKWEIPR